MGNSGILLHISSLPSAYGIGDLGPQAFAFVDFLEGAAQQYWQVLPVNPTDGINAHSPYSCSSAFAGNPLLISPQVMVIDGLLTLKDLATVPAFSKTQIDYDAVRAYKDGLLHTAYARWSRDKSRHDAYQIFCKAQGFWLDDYAVFTAAKKVYNGQCWRQWPRALRDRDTGAVRRFCKTHDNAVEEVKFIQFVFFSQWERLTAYAHEHNVKIIGDIPIYVNFDSADVWCHRQYFKLNESGDLKFVSGCPPDYFSKTGQRWGNPVYDWTALKKNKYSWWVKRVAHNLNLFDCLRIDHFRGFESFWQIPAQEKLAVFGKWVKAPGKDFFGVLSKQFNDIPIIAEDLGEITPEVVALMKQFGFPGMRVLLFGFGGDPKTNPHVPANYGVNCVAYTGTHDNNTIVGWVQHEAKPFELNALKRILKVQKIALKQVHWQMIDALMASRARTVIIPLVDVLGLGQDARMNLPSTTVRNWKWRFKRQDLTDKVLKRLLKSTQKYQRG